MFTAGAVLGGYMQRSILFAATQRDKAIKIAMKRKEEFLGARVPKELRNRVIERANELGIPVSILIRNILEDAFSGDKAPQSSQTGSSAENKKYTELLGWEQITLNKSIVCHHCGSDMNQGDNAHFGIGDPKGRQIVICEQCSKALL